MTQRFYNYTLLRFVLWFLNAHVATTKWNEIEQDKTIRSASRVSLYLWYEKRQETHWCSLQVQAALHHHCSLWHINRAKLAWEHNILHAMRKGAVYPMIRRIKQINSSSYTESSILSIPEIDFDLLWSCYNLPTAFFLPLRTHAPLTIRTTLHNLLLQPTSNLAQSKLNLEQPTTNLTQFRVNLSQPTSNLAQLPTI